MSFQFNTHKAMLNANIYKNITIIDKIISTLIKFSKLHKLKKQFKTKNYYSIISEEKCV